MIGAIVFLLTVSVTSAFVITGGWKWPFVWVLFNCTKPSSAYCEDCGRRMYYRYKPYKYDTRNGKPAQYKRELICIRRCNVDILGGVSSSSYEETIDEWQYVQEMRDGVAPPTNDGPDESDTSYHRWFMTPLFWESIYSGTPQSNDADKPTEEE